MARSKNPAIATADDAVAMDSKKADAKIGVVVTTIPLYTPEGIIHPGKYIIGEKITESTARVLIDKGLATIAEE